MHKKNKNSLSPLQPSSSSLSPPLTFLSLKKEIEGRRRKKREEEGKGGV